MPAPPLSPGAVLAQRYDVLRLIGDGGMGYVYETHDRSLAVKGAVKVMKGSSRDADARARFRSEVVLARKVRHKNVCAIHDYGADGELEFISMELVEGQDLRHLIHQEGALDWDRAFDVALQICDGLLAIHEAGIIHRDLKPANLMLEPHGLVKVMDFGVAKVGTTGAESHTQTGMVVGTPEYMSPEQVRGGEIDSRSDLYALGVVIYEMFTGKVPFHADTPFGTMLLHLEEPLPLDPAPPRLPGPLVAVLRQALAKHTADRFASAAEMREALEEARGSSGGTDPVPVVEDGVDSGERRTELPRRRPPASLRPAATLPPEARLLLPMLTRALRNPQGDIRLQAARALALHGRSAALAIPSLQALAADPLQEIRETVALALKQIGPEPSSAPATPDPSAGYDSNDVASSRPEVRAGPMSEGSRDAATQLALETPVPGGAPVVPAREPAPPNAERPTEALVPDTPVSAPAPLPRPGPPLSRAPSPPTLEPVAAPAPVSPRPTPSRHRSPPLPRPRGQLPPWLLSLLVGAAVLGFGWWILPARAPVAPPPTLPPTTEAAPTTTIPSLSPTTTTSLSTTTTTTLPRRVVAGGPRSSTSTTVATTTTTTVEPSTTTTSSTTTTTSTSTTTTTLLAVQAGDLVRSDDPGAEPPTCERCPPVPYPSIARDPRVAAEGRVDLRLLVDDKGGVTILDAVYRPLPSRRAASAAGQKILVDAAVSGVKKWRFSPARKQGVPVRMELARITVVEFRFQE